MLTRRSCVFRVLLNGMRRSYGQRSDRDRTAHDEENLVHRNSQSDAQSQQQRHACAINASVSSFDCFHDIPFWEKVIARDKRRSA
jgi:hypothetical protein